jgi:hypothetical protein
LWTGKAGGRDKRGGVWREVRRWRMVAERRAWLDWVWGENRLLAMSFKILAEAARLHSTLVS